MTDGDAPENGYERLESLPLHSTTLLTVLDAEGVILYESPSIERIYGFDQDELIGESVADYFHPEDREEVVAAFETLVESDDDTVQSVEYRHEAADGSWRWMESVGSAEPTPEGNYVINSREIEDQKRRERRLVRQNERLDAFAKIVSHDLRNPLSVANGHLELAREQHDSEHLQSVERAHDRMRTLIDDLLTLARKNEGVADLEPTPLADLVERAWENVAATEATLAIETDVAVMADESRLAQLLENLLANAVEHADAPVTVTVGDYDGGFFVEDDGPGIPEANRDDIFEAGYSTTSEGTGIGLKIVETIAEAHGWSVDVVEGREGGTRFEITGVEDSDR